MAIIKETIDLTDAEWEDTGERTGLYLDGEKIGELTHYEVTVDEDRVIREVVDED